jgi:hypothetical protein
MKTKVSEKMIENDLSRVEDSATKSTYKLGVGFERCDNKDEKSAPKFIPTSNYHKEVEALKPTKTNLPIQSNDILQPQERGTERNPYVERGSFCLHILWSCWSLG